MSHQLTFSTCSRFHSSRLWSTIAGLVLGMSNTVATPPSTAARVPVAIDSTEASPGSRMLHMAVDQARQDMQPARVDNFRCGIARQSPDLRDAPVDHADVRRRLAPGQNADAAANQKVVMH